ncbi:phosphopantetheine-binding protein [Streptomyces flaveolus]|uniref:phosphopantetheine-binding protein n=1 Tax=Streptomyces flaveolus TaxID=67297 RepID=UPI0033B0DF98
MTSLPRTPHGKIDRAALAASHDSRTGTVWAPYDDASRMVAHAWEAVFGQPPRSADEDFFDAGGHSLTAAQLVGALCSVEPRCGVAVRQIFTARTPGALAEAIRQARRAARIAEQLRDVLRAVPHDPDAPLTGLPAAAADDSDGPTRTTTELSLSEGAARALNRISGGRAAEELVVTADVGGMGDLQVRRASARIRCPVDVAAAATPADLVVAVDRAVRAAAPARGLPGVLVASQAIAPPAGRVPLSVPLLGVTEAGRRLLRLEAAAEGAGQRTAEALRHGRDQALSCFAQPREPFPERVASSAAPVIHGTDNRRNL